MLYLERNLRNKKKEVTNMKKTNLTKSILALTTALALSHSPQATTFTDVSESHWAYGYIEDMASRGYMNGKGDGLFSPDTTLSNAEFCTIMANAFYGETLGVLRQENSTYWWEPYVESCYLRGGLTNTTPLSYYQSQNSWDYAAGLEVIRFDAAQMITNLLDEQGFFPLPDSVVPIVMESITDPVPEEYQTAVASAFYYGFLGGRQDGSFDGYATLTRGETAVILAGLVNSGVLQEELIPQYTTVEGVGDVHANVYEVFLLVNQERAALGLDPFTLDLKLCELAQSKSDEMAEYDYIDHTSPITGYFTNMFYKAGIDPSTATENLARGQRTPAAVVEEWMNSPDHRKNLVSTLTAKIGIGFTQKDYCWSQLFTDANANTNGEVTDLNNLQVYGEATVDTGTEKGLYSMEMLTFMYDNYLEVGYDPKNQIIAVPLENIGEMPLTFDSISLVGGDSWAFNIAVRPSIISKGAISYVEIEPIEGLEAGGYDTVLHVTADNLSTISQYIAISVH